MNETEFKVLMYCGIYVDINLLEKGIYYTEKPYLFSKNDTIENIIKHNKTFFKDKKGNSFLKDEYFENISKCELVPIKIQF